MLSNFLGVKDQNGNIAGFLNGSSDNDELKNNNSDAIMMMGVGVNGGITNKITLYPWSCAESVDDGYSLIYTTTDYFNSDIALTIKDNTSIKTYVYESGEIIECPGFSYIKNPETNSSETSIVSDANQTIYRSVNHGNENKVGYTYSRATSMPNKTENAVNFTPTRIYSDGTVIINKLITTNGEFNGEINANGYFYGTVSSDKGYLEHYNINRSIIRNSDIILRHVFEETDDDTYEDYNTLTCADRNNNVLFKLGPSNLDYTSQQYTVSVNTVNSYHKNSNGNDSGLWYGTSGAWNSMSSFKVNGGETIKIPAVEMYMWIWTSGRHVVKYPSYGLRVAYYSGSTLVSTEILQSYSAIAPYKGGGKGGYSYFSKITPTTTLQIPSNINIVKLEYCWKMHLHTYAWLGADKSAGEITITPYSNILVQNGQRYNIIEIGGNGLRITQGNTNPVLFQVLPTGIVMERDNMGIRICQKNSTNSAVYMKIGGQGYKEVIVENGYLKLSDTITNFN